MSYLLPACWVGRKGMYAEPDPKSHGYTNLVTCAEHAIMIMRKIGTRSFSKIDVACSQKIKNQKRSHAIGQDMSLAGSMCDVSLAGSMCLDGDSKADKHNLNL